MLERKVQTNNPMGETLVGLETQPDEQKEKYPTVILVHGFGATKEESGMFDGIANNLSGNGFLVYRFDFSGRGESEGNYQNTSLSKQRDDLKAILDFVRLQPLVDTDHIGIAAQSFGTPTTITLHPEIQSLVLMGSFGHVKEVLQRLFGAGYNPTGVSTRVKTDGEIVHLNPVFWQDFANHDILNSIKKIHCPILFIHGGNDDTVPITEMETLYQLASNNKEKVILEGADHGLEPKRDEMNKVLANWFKKTLNNENPV